MANESQSVADVSAVQELIGDRYQIFQTLGRGGMGIVLKARHVRLNKPVAIKILSSALLLDDVSKQRFEIEAQASSMLNHPNLVATFDYGITKNSEPYLVMEYIEGASLEQCLARDGPPAILNLLEILIQICKALQYVHSNNIVHRDLKTSNIMIQSIGTERYAKLLDFGIAKVFNDDGETAHRLTATGSVFGSPMYMSPEQCQGKKVDARSDIYSLGCVMYECIAGVPPIKGENPLHTIFKQVSEDPAPLAFNTESEYELATMTMRCLKKAPEDRYQSAGELLVALQSLKTRIDHAGAGSALASPEMKANFARAQNDKLRAQVPPPEPENRVNQFLRASAKKPDAPRQSAVPRGTPVALPSQAPAAPPAGSPFAQPPGSAVPHSSGSATPVASTIELKPWYQSLKKRILILTLAVAIIELAFRIFTIIPTVPHVLQLQQDLDGVYERTHRQLQQYNQRLDEQQQMTPGSAAPANPNSWTNR